MYFVFYHFVLLDDIKLYVVIYIFVLNVAFIDIWLLDARIKFSSLYIPQGHYFISTLWLWSTDEYGNLWFWAKVLLILTIIIAFFNPITYTLYNLICVSAKCRLTSLSSGLFSSQQLLLLRLLNSCKFIWTLFLKIRRVKCLNPTS